MTEPLMDERANGVSIVTCTNKLYFMDNIFENYQNQEWTTKELIIILNNDLLNLDEWKVKGEEFCNVTIFQLPEEVSLGNCLNFGVSMAKYDYLAKFDDDDYYAPLYLTEAMNSFQEQQVHIVGKRSYYLYLEQKKQLMLRFPNRENQLVKRVHGGTIVAKRKVFEQVPFPDLSLGEDKYFFQSCTKMGFQIYSTSHFHYTYLRRAEHFHTWEANIGYLFRTSKKISITTDYKNYTDPP